MYGLIIILLAVVAFKFSKQIIHIFGFLFGPLFKGIANALVTMFTLVLGFVIVGVVVETFVFAIF